jgi:uncharacterized membrane protein YphA (DoxX/SURF4 family)
MDNLSQPTFVIIPFSNVPARVLFGIPFVAFGVQYLIYGRFAGGLPPAPPWTPGAPATAYLLGALLIVAGARITINAKTQLTGTLLGILLFVCVALMFIATPSAILHDGTARTRTLEPLALAGAAWVLAGSQSTPSDAQSWDVATGRLATVGRLIFGLSMVVFGAQHFMYGGFIATLIPPWLPGHLFWTYFFGVALIAAGISIVTGIQARLAAILLGVMFLLWIVVLHAPRVAATPHNGDEWSSLFVAIAMCGSCLIIAAASVPKRLSNDLINRDT